MIQDFLFNKSAVQGIQKICDAKIASNCGQEEVAGAAAAQTFPKITYRIVLD